MTVLEVMLTIALAVTVPGVVWLAVDTWALRRDVNRLDGEVATQHRARRSVARRVNDLTTRVWTIEAQRDTTGDLDVPHVDDPDTPTTPVYRPVPAHFHEWR